MLPIRLGRRHPPGLAILEKAPGQRRGPNLLTDGDMEDVGVGAWTAVVATLTKETGSPAEGVRSLRVAASSAPSSGYASQSVLTAGHTYRLTGWARGGGVARPRIFDGSYFWSGTTSTTWQEIDVTWVATLTGIFRMYCYAPAANGDWVEYDGLYLSEE